MADTFLVSVADAIGIDPTTGNALFHGTANISSAFTLSMSSADVRAGRNNGLRFKYMHTRDLAVNVEQAIFEKTFIALNSGSNVLNQTVNVLNTDCVELTNGVGTLDETPASGVTVSVIRANGVIVPVTPSGDEITVPGSTGSEKVTAIYRYADQVDRIAISSTEPPSIITLILTADVRNTDGQLVERFQVEVLNFQIDGSAESTLPVYIVIYRMNSEYAGNSLELNLVA